MSRKIEHLYEQVTGWDPKRMEPKPTEPHMRQTIKRYKEYQEKANLLILPDSSDRYQIERGKDGDGVFTAIIDRKTKKIAFVPGDHTRSPDVLKLPKKNDWINIRGDGETGI
jgi:hypothetical protein